MEEELRAKTDASLGEIDKYILAIEKEKLNKGQFEFFSNLLENKKTVQDRVEEYLIGKFPEEWLKDKGVLSHKLVSALARVNEYSSLILEGIAGPVDEETKTKFKNIHDEAKKLEIILRDHVNRKFG